MSYWKFRSCRELDIIMRHLRISPQWSRLWRFTSLVQQCMLRVRTFYTEVSELWGNFCRCCLDLWNVMQIFSLGRTILHDTKDKLRIARLKYMIKVVQWSQLIRSISKLRCAQDSSCIAQSNTQAARAALHPRNPRNWEVQRSRKKLGARS